MKRTFSKFRKLFYIPASIRILIDYRDAIRVLTWKDFQARFRGSIFGILWALAQPLLMMVVYTLVFSYFLKVRFNASDSPYIFAVYLLCGLVPWNAFNEGINTSCSLMRANPNLIKKVVFPLEILPINLTLVTMIQQCIGLILLLFLTIIVTGTLHWQFVFILIFLLLQFILQTGLSWILSSLSVFIPDIRIAISLIMLLLMFVTPIMYPENLIPDRAHFLVTLNPIAHIINMYRNVLMEGRIPAIGSWLWATGFSLVFWLIGYIFFSRTKRAFPDYL